MDTVAGAPVIDKNSPEEQSKAFIAALKGDNVGGEDDDEPVAAVGRPKAKSKAKAKGKAKAKAVAKVSVGKPGKKLFNPTYGVEASRSQVQCRTGLTFKEGGVAGASFKFSDYPSGQKGAEATAKKWVADFRNRHTCKG